MRPPSEPACTRGIDHRTNSDHSGAAGGPLSEIHSLPLERFWTLCPWRMTLLNSRMGQPKLPKGLSDTVARNLAGVKRYCCILSG